MARGVAKKLTAADLRSKVFVTGEQSCILLGIPRATLSRIRQADKRYPDAVSLPGRSRPVFRVADLLQWAERRR